MKSRKNANILPPRQFARRLVKYSLFAFGLVSISLGIGVIGYHFIGQLGWIDSIYNASMILTGMGPIDKMNTVAAKLFASAYAIFSGVAFLSTVALFFAPIAHRLMHLLHIDEKDVD